MDDIRPFTDVIDHLPVGELHGGGEWAEDCLEQGDGVTDPVVYQPGGLNDLGGHASDGRSLGDPAPVIHFANREPDRIPRPVRVSPVDALGSPVDRHVIPRRHQLDEIEAESRLPVERRGRQVSGSLVTIREMHPETDRRVIQRRSINRGFDAFPVCHLWHLASPVSIVRVELIQLFDESLFAGEL